MSVEFYRESPGKFDSRTLNRKTLNRWTGRTSRRRCVRAHPTLKRGYHGVFDNSGIYIHTYTYIYIYIYIYLFIYIGRRLSSSGTMSGISRLRFVDFSNQLPCSSNVLLCCFLLLSDSSNRGMSKQYPLTVFLESPTVYVLIVLLVLSLS